VDNLSLALSPSAKIAGRVVFDGAATTPPPARLQQMTITLGAGAGSQSFSTRLDAEARFSFAGVLPGRYNVTVAETAAELGPEWPAAVLRIGGTVIRGPVTVGTTDITDAVITLTDKVITVSGRVQGESAAVAGSTVALFPAGAAESTKAGHGVGPMATAGVSASGEFQLRIASPGDYLVVAIPPEIEPEIDAQFIARYAPFAEKVSLKLGDTRTLSLSLARAK
jgi:hypothetical protein